MPTANVFAMVFLLITLSPVNAAKPNPNEAIPDALKPWIGWVLYDEKRLDCPIHFNQKDERECIWPAELRLTVDKGSAKFEQLIQVFAESDVVIPGNLSFWPQQVQVDGISVSVLAKKERPVIRLQPGIFRVSGNFQWDDIPEFINVSAKTGIIQLAVNGDFVQSVNLDGQGRLWLKPTEATDNSEKLQKVPLKLEVFRKIIDDIPMRVETRIELEVSGKQREINIGRVLLDSFIPLALESTLPAKLEADGQLRLQVRPGHWNVTLTARSTTHPTNLSLTRLGPLWPEEEIWVFDAKPNLRVVELSGLDKIDPRQTNLPKNWRVLPAYVIKPSQQLSISQVRRGDPESNPDQLRLVRELWLDFDGGGYTAKDAITGTKSTGWRLEAQELLKLGRVVIDGEPQFITTLPGQTAKGVELRRGTLQLEAESRYEDDIANIPALGWQQDFQNVRVSLNLPPGWRILSATGMDNTPNTWLQRWTLFDLFMVLILSIAVARLWNNYWGGLALVTLVLTWHQPNAPGMIWANLLVAIAILRALPSGRFSNIVSGYKNISLIALVIILVPFLVSQVRTAIYPQLEQPHRMLGAATSPQSMAKSMAAPMQPSELAMEEAASAPAKELDRSTELRRREPRLSKPESSDLRLKIDPNAIVQTGPGLPQWKWRSVKFHWNGPVSMEQQLKITYLSPGAQLVIKIASVILLIFLSFLMLDVVDRKSIFKLKSFTLYTTVMVWGCVGILSMYSLNAVADIPDEKTLDLLKQRLLEPAPCLPQCAEIPNIKLTLNDEYLDMQISIHTAETVAVPLPAGQSSWFPNELHVNGKPATAVLRGSNNGLWIQLAAGQNIVRMRGHSPKQNHFQLFFPLKPHFVQYTASGWSVVGIKENSIPDSQIHFTRVEKLEQSKQENLQTPELPPFFKVQRNLSIGLDWQVDTIVRRQSPLGTSVAVAIPLLPGESVLTENIQVQDDKVFVNLGPQQRQQSWKSAIEKTPKLLLTASQTDVWVEIWRLNVSPIWRLQASGLPQIFHQSKEGYWAPEWRPWPGEQLQLDFIKPVGAKGNSLTITHSLLKVNPGHRATDVSLGLNVRSSQGGQHTIQLPASAVIQRVEVDGLAQPLRLDGEQLKLPVHPGDQTFMIQWRSNQGIRALFHTPSVNVGIENVNSNIQTSLGRDRWVLFAGGSPMGPAVLFWGELLVVILFAFALSRTKLTPLRLHHWLLLGIGLSQVPIWMSVVVVGWLMALGARARISAEMKNWKFNLMQISLALLSMLAISFLFSAVQQGLLGTPDMQISGNLSSANQLNWYQDRSTEILPSAWLLSVPTLYYRILMLLWSLWLAFSLLRWLIWGWKSASTEGLWRKWRTDKREKTSTTEPVASATLPDSSSTE